MLRVLGCKDNAGHEQQRHLGTERHARKILVSDRDDSETELVAFGRRALPMRTPNTRRDPGNLLRQQRENLRVGWARIGLRRRRCARAIARDVGQGRAVELRRLGQQRGINTISHRHHSTAFAEIGSSFARRSVRLAPDRDQAPDRDRRQGWWGRHRCARRQDQAAERFA